MAVDGRAILRFLTVLSLCATAIFISDRFSSATSPQRGLQRGGAIGSGSGGSGGGGDGEGGGEELRPVRVRRQDESYLRQAFGAGPAEHTPMVSSPRSPRPQLDAGCGSGRAGE